MELQKTNNSDIIQSLVLQGDLSKMNESQKVHYYKEFCTSLGLNPLTQPFQLIIFQGKQRLYATKDCTEQLRKIHGVSITDVQASELRGVYVVTAKALDKTGKTDASTGVVNIEGLKGDNLANALMKAETKAKRRVTLSICGLGILDETETETMKGAVTQDIDAEISDVPGIDDRKKLITLVHKSDLDKVEQDAAYQEINLCTKWNRYDQIKYKLEARRKPVDQTVNPSQAQINEELNQFLG